MPATCISQPTTTSTIPRRRQLAWQISLMLPFIVVIPLFIREAPPEALWQTVSGMLLLALVITAAVTDVLWHKIPNWATYSAFGWAVAINALSMFSSETTAGILGAVGLADCLVGAILLFCFMLVIFSMTGGGAGDVKLTAAIGALLGLDRAIDAILLSFIFAGGLALLRAVWLQGPYNLAIMVSRGIGSWILPLWVLPPSEEHRAFMRQPMPLGPSFAIGSILMLFELNVDQLLGMASSLWGDV